jgi:hypothetical protein
MKISIAHPNPVNPIQRCEIAAPRQRQPDFQSQRAATGHAYKYPTRSPNSPHERDASERSHSHPRNRPRRASQPLQPHSHPTRTWKLDCARRGAARLGFGGPSSGRSFGPRSALAAILSNCGSGGGAAVAAGEEQRAPYPLPPTHPRPQQLGAAIDALLLNPVQGSDRSETHSCPPADARNSVRSK